MNIAGHCRACSVFREIGRWGSGVHIKISICCSKSSERRYVVEVEGEERFMYVWLAWQLMALLQPLRIEVAWQPSMSYNTNNTTDKSNQIYICVIRKDAEHCHRAMCANHTNFLSFLVTQNSVCRLTRMATIALTRLSVPGSTAMPIFQLQNKKAYF